MRKSTINLAVVALASFVVSCKAQGTCESKDADVLILGAGMSGIAAAKTLYDNGVTNFVILEARDEIGGRMRAAEFAGVKIELGANWIQGVDPSGCGRYKVNPLWALKQQCGLQGVFSDYNSLVVYNSEGVNVTGELPWSEIHTVVEKVSTLSKKRQEEGEDDISIREALVMSNWNPTTPEDKFVDWYKFDWCDAIPPENVSLYASEVSVMYEEFGNGNFFVTDQRGFAFLVQCLADKFLNDGDNRLHFNTKVSLVEYTDDCVCATATENGQQTRYCSSYGILTFSLGVLQHDVISFNPPLSQEKLDAINMFDFVLFQKVFVEFNATFWDSDVQFFGRAASDRENYTMFQPLGQYFEQQPNAVFATLTGATAFTVQAQTIELTKQQIRQALESAYGEFQAEIVDVLVPDWASNPLYFGTYSSPKVHVTKQTYVDLASPLGNLYFSGEATSEHYYAYVHGAYFAGIDTAKAILSAYAVTNAAHIKAFFSVKILAVLIVVPWLLL